MRKGILLLFCISFLGCESTEKKPDNVLDKVTMAGVFTDIMINERIVASRVLPMDSSIKIYQGTYVPWLYEKYNLSKETMDTSMDYYLKHTEQLKEVIQIVIDTLTIRSETGRFR